MRSRWISWSLAGLVVLAAPSLRAQSSTSIEEARSPSGIVVRLEAGRLVVAMEPPARVIVGARMGLFRPVTVRHPVTHRTLSDLIPLGSVVIEHVGAELTTARVVGELADAARVGDVLAAASDTPVAPSREAPSMEAPAAPQRPVAPALPPLTTLPPPPQGPVSPTSPTSPSATPSPSTPAPLPAQPATPVNVEQQQVAAMLFAGLGRPLDERVMNYNRYLLSTRGSGYSGPLRAEIATLTQASRALRIATSDDASRSPSEPRPAGDALLPTSLREGEPCLIAIQLESSAGRGEGALFVRRSGAPTYERVEMRSEGDGYLRARIPQSYVTVGTIEYFVEFSRRDGQTSPLVGRADEPRAVEVLSQPEGPPAAEGRSRIDLRGELADVGTRTVNGVQRVQRFVTFEGDFLQRLNSSWLYGYRVGFGVYDGDALSLSALATPNTSVHTRVIYGYHELEFAFSDFVHLIARAQVGVFNEGMVLGTQARLRIGHERRTNVLLGGELLGEVGQRAFFALNFAPIERVPMMAQGEVFNQSVAAGDPMFRFIAQVGWRMARWITVSVRGSYQLRNIENGGFGGGLNTAFEW